MYLNWDWEGRIKPQVLMARGVGANTVKIGASTRSVVSGQQTRAVFHDHVRQFIEYAGEQGLYVILNCHVYEEDLNPANDPATLDEIVAEMEMVGVYENVIAITASNEINLWVSEADALAHMQALYPAVKQVAPYLPLSPSFNFEVASGWTQPANWSVGSMAQFEPYVDFWAMHPYYQSGDPSPADLANFRAAPYYKNWLIDEIGQDAAKGQAAQTARWTAVDALSQLPECSGAVGYVVQDADARDYAMFAEDGTERTWISTPFKNWPSSYSL